MPCKDNSSITYTRPHRRRNKWSEADKQSAIWILVLFGINRPAHIWFFPFFFFFSFRFYLSICAAFMHTDRYMNGGLVMLFYDGINFPLSQNAYGGMKSGTLAMACLNDVPANRFVCAISCLLPYVCLCLVLFCNFFHPALFQTDCCQNA